MGTGHSTRRMSFDVNGQVNFDHFQILRAIGKGSFGKVCIVQKKDTKQMFAMKYMNKAMCVRQTAISNVVRELNMLTRLEHPFLVNLWYAFQDEEDMFMVVDLLLGGDFRYHMQQDVTFSEECVKLYLCELALALDYLGTNSIVHRDIKPDNILLDEQGHCHITDFNIATQLAEDELATSMTGTRPYMAPEVYGTALNERRGYSFPVDWWSLGVTMFELLKKRRPFAINANTSIQETWAIMLAARGQSIHAHNLSDGMKDLLRLLLEFEPQDRLCSLAQLKQHAFMTDVNFEDVLSRNVSPPFVPSKEHLNCDPTYELEEMIIETKPLHKKKKRLAKQNSKLSTEGERDEADNLTKAFQYYNREESKSYSSGFSDTVRRNSPTTIKTSRLIPNANVSPQPGSNRHNDVNSQHHQQQEYHHHHQKLQAGPTVQIPHLTTPQMQNSALDSVSPLRATSLSTESCSSPRTSCPGHLQRQQRLSSSQTSSEQNDDGPPSRADT